MAYVNQSRILGAPSYSGRIFRPSTGQNFPSGPTTIHAGGTQQTYSWRTSKSLRPELEYEQLSGEFLRGRVAHEHRTRYDNGHEFSTTKADCFVGLPKVTLRDSTIPSYLAYEGPLWLSHYEVGGGYPTPVLPTTAEIHADGNRAVKATLPTVPEASLAQFLGELREKLPQLIGLESYRKGLNSKTIGGEYLNVEFGVKPFISDITKLSKNVLEFKKVLNQYRTDSDKKIRRRYPLSDVTEHSVTQTPGALGMFSYPFSGTASAEFQFFGNNITVLSRQDTSIKKSWFSGAYSYHLTEAVDFTSRMERYEELANQLLGTRITPSTVWELTPWSWLIDWNVDVGGFLRTLEAFRSDSLVLRYAYVMHEIHAKRAYSAVRPLVDRGGNSVLPTLHYSKVSKVRTRATPYGFQLSPSYTVRQMAILGALGMTRNPSQVRTD